MLRPNISSFPPRHTPSFLISNSLLVFLWSLLLPICSMLLENSRRRCQLLGHGRCGRQFSRTVQHGVPEGPRHTHAARWGPIRRQPRGPGYGVQALPDHCRSMFILHFVCLLGIQEVNFLYRET
uniref:Uncharacterized protein n=1 Tax=Cacopsylla melanoneura TaxID=428564 RepID=A0A8D8QCK0_9HEMI